MRKMTVQFRILADFLRCARVASQATIRLYLCWSCIIDRVYVCGGKLLLYGTAAAAGINTLSH